MSDITLLKSVAAPCSRCLASVVSARIQASVCHSMYNVAEGAGEIEAGVSSLLGLDTADT